MYSACLTQHSETFSKFSKPTALAKDKGKGLRSSKDPLLLEDPQTHRATYGDRVF